MHLPLRLPGQWTGSRAASSVWHGLTSPAAGPEARMRLFDRSAGKLAAGPTLLLSADPGPALLDAARLYDPGVRHWNLLGRLVFSNGVLLFGPVEVTLR